MNIEALLMSGAVVTHNNSVLLVGNLRSVYLHGLWKNLQQNGVNVFGVDNQSLYFVKTLSDFEKKARFFQKIKKNKFIKRAIQIRNYLFLVPKLRKLTNIGLHTASHRYKILFPLFSSKANITCTVWGSDYLQQSEKSRKSLIPIFRKMDKITFTGVDTLNDFNSFYKNEFQSKLHVTRFGLGSLDKIKTLKTLTKNQHCEKLKISPNHFFVTIGTSATPEQQHNEIINSLKNITHSLTQKITFLIPLTYGNADYRSRVKDQLSKTTLKYFTFDHFMSDDLIASLRCLTDIYVNLQKTDQFSGTMQESIYAGSQIIAGSWLPYQHLDQLGFKLNYIDSISQLSSKIEDVLNTHGPKEIDEKIYHLSGWPNCIANWKNIYSVR